MVESNTVSLISDIKELQKLQEEIKNRLKDAIKAEIGSCEPLDGVKVLSPICCAVKLGTVMKENKLSPEIYHPEIQIKNVMGYLFPEKGTTVEAITKKISEMAKTGKFNYPTSRETQYLNSNMLETIKRLSTEITAIS